MQLGVKLAEGEDLTSITKGKIWSAVCATKKILCLSASFYVMQLDEIRDRNRTCKEVLLILKEVVNNDRVHILVAMSRCSVSLKKEMR